MPPIAYLSRILRALPALAVVAMLAGCFGSGKELPPPVVQAPPPPPAPDNSLQPVELAVNKIAIRHGQKIGIYRCRANEEIIWRAGALHEDSNEFTAVFTDAARAAAIPIGGRGAGLFTQAAQNERPSYRIGSSIVAMNADLCVVFDIQKLSPYTPPVEVYVGEYGSATVTIDWEVFSPLENQVVYRLRTSGSHTDNKTQPRALSIFIANAYRDAASKLVANAGFRNAISRAPGGIKAAAVAPVQEQRWLVPALQPFQAPLQQNAQYLASAAVTIDIGSGHGSGFFLTADGWIMTNAHVARGSKVVKVILADGRSVFAQVVRVHDARDVALIKVDGTGYPALPLRMQPVRLTEEVYAIGTPIDKKLSGTVTRGIVSRFATNRMELTDIQADVAIQGGNSGGPLLDSYGNVVGISYAGFGRLNAGLNFFIPIQDALEKLNLQLGGT